MLFEFFLALTLTFGIAATVIGQNRGSQAAPDIHDKQFVAQLMTGISPIINGNWVTFVYRGKEKSVELVGELTGWSRRGLRLKKLRGKEIRYLSVQIPDDARIEYKYLINGNWQLDPLNPNRNDNGVGGWNNFLVMPNYKPSEWAHERTDIRHGRLEDITAQVGGAKHQIRVYLPPGYDSSTEHYPTLYLGDGLEYIERAKANIIADNLIASRRIRPVIMIFIAPVNRMKEYWVNADYVNYLVKEVVPKVDAKYRTVRKASARAIGGASLGGLIAAFAAYHRPAVFGNVLGQSSSFWVNSMQVIREVAASPKKPIKWFLEVGRYEPLTDQNRRMRSILESKGYTVGYREIHAGHNWTHWKDTFADGLTYLFPASYNGL